MEVGVDVELAEVVVEGGGRSGRPWRPRGWAVRRLSECPGVQRQEQAVFPAAVKVGKRGWGHWVRPLWVVVDFVSGRARAAWLPGGSGGIGHFRAWGSPSGASKSKDDLERAQAADLKMPVWAARLLRVEPYWPAPECRGDVPLGLEAASRPARARPGRRWLAAHEADAGQGL